MVTRYNLEFVLNLYGRRQGDRVGSPSYGAACQLLLLDAEACLTGQEYAVMSARLGSSEHVPMTLEEVGDGVLGGLTGARAGGIETTALGKLVRFREERIEYDGDDLAACVEQFGNDYSLDDLGEHGKAYLQDGLRKLEEVYGQGLANDVLNVLRRARVTRDFYSGNLSNRMIPLTQLGLSSRVRHVLQNLGVRRAGDITQYSPEELLAERVFGEGGLRELKRTLKKLGLALRK